MSTAYDKAKNGWNRDWETDNFPDEWELYANGWQLDGPPDMSHVHIETCDGCDFPVKECRCEVRRDQ